LFATFVFFSENVAKSQSWQNTVFHYILILQNIMPFRIDVILSSFVRLYILHIELCLLYTGASDESVDLLPAPTLTSNWTNTLPTDDGNDGDKIYAFDGLTNAVVVPDKHVNHKLGKHFTISTWMKHTFPNTVLTDHKNGNKEHLICMSDGEGKCQYYRLKYSHIEPNITLLIGLVYT